MKQPKLSVIFPNADDYDGAWFSIMAQRLYQKGMSDVEIVLLDNRPESKAGKQLKIDCDNYFGTRTAGVKYVPFNAVKSTALAKQAGIKACSGKAFICMDSHILLHNTDALLSLMDYFDNNPNSKDLITGPLLYDSMQAIETHLNFVFRDTMFGIWGKAFRYQDRNFSVIGEAPLYKDGMARFIRLDVGCQIEDIDIGLKPVPMKEVWQHLEHYGATQLGWNDTEMFEVPGNGMGVFAGITANFPGFNEGFRGFGFEEGYLSQKYRALGKHFCKPDLKWIHRFNRPSNNIYEKEELATSRVKVKNFILGFKDHEWSLDLIHDHFVNNPLLEKENKGITEEVYQAILEGREELPLSVVARRDTLTALYEGVLNNEKNYFSKHAPKMAELSKDGEVVEITRYQETTFSLLGGKPKKMFSYVFQGADDLVLERLKTSACPQSGVEYDYVVMDEYNTVDIPECDFLMFKTPHAYQNLLADLNVYAPKVRKFIALHDTQRQLKGLDGGLKPGYGYVINEFMIANKEWFILHHSLEQVGFTVLCRIEELRPNPEIRLFPPTDGPGKQLHELLEQADIKPKHPCDCAKIADNMNFDGVAGCEAKLDYYWGEIKRNETRWKWMEKWGNYWKGFTSGIVLELPDKVNVARGLVLRAIELEKERLAAEKNTPPVEWNTDGTILFLDDSATRIEKFTKAVPTATVVKTAAECIEKLKASAWDVVRLDHDLEGQFYSKPEGVNTGSEVVRFLVANKDTVSVKNIIVHSHNPTAGPQMEIDLQEAGFNVVRKAFGSN